MRQYLISVPGLAPFVTWGDSPSAAIAAGVEFLGVPLRHAVAVPYDPPCLIEDECYDHSEERYLAFLLRH